MPRKSSEELAGAIWRQRSKPPSPPARLGKEARELWQQIVLDRGPEHFRGSNFELLAQYVELCCDARQLSKTLSGLGGPTDPKYASMMRTRMRLITTINSLAKTLRLPPQSDIDRKSGRLSEKGHGLGDHPLLGGFAVHGEA
jgi:hypothetical protein